MKNSNHITNLRYEVVCKNAEREPWNGIFCVLITNDDWKSPLQNEPWVLFLLPILEKLILIYLQIIYLKKVLIFFSLWNLLANCTRKWD